MASDAVTEDELDAVVASIEVEQPSDGAQPPAVEDGPPADGGPQPAPALEPEAEPEPPAPRPGQLPPLEQPPAPVPAPPPLDNPFLKKKVYTLPPAPEPEPEPEQDPGVRDGGKGYHTDGMRVGGTTTVLWEVSLDAVAMGDALPIESMTVEDVAGLSVTETKAELTRRGANAQGRPAGGQPSDHPILFFAGISEIWLGFLSAEGAAGGQDHPRPARGGSGPPVGAVHRELY